MTDIVDPATLRPGDVVDVTDRNQVAVVSVGLYGLATSHGWLSLDLAKSGWTRTWHLVSRAEPERGSVWRSESGVEWYYEPDDRWPGKLWTRCDYGSRMDLPLADMTFVRSAVTS